jgi:hypothetical protein
MVILAFIASPGSGCSCAKEQPGDASYSIGSREGISLRRGIDRNGELLNQQGFNSREGKMQQRAIHIQPKGRTYACKSYISWNQARWSCRPA